MTENLRQAIDGLYAAFAAVARPKTIDGCRCCIDDAGVATLLTKPLREITERELSSYAASALLTVGTPADYRYYLPRILELNVRCGGWWPDIEVIGRAMFQAQWFDWTEKERVAIEHFFQMRIEDLILEKLYFELDGYICGAARARVPVAPLLTRIASSVEAVLGFYQQNANELPEQKLANAFWEEEQEAARPVIHWFFSPEIKAIILDAYGVDLSQVSSR